MNDVQSITFWNCGDCGAMLTAKGSDNGDEMIKFHAEWHDKINKQLGDLVKTPNVTILQGD